MICETIKYNFIKRYYSDGTQLKFNKVVTVPVLSYSTEIMDTNELLVELWITTQTQIVKYRPLKGCS